jgi:hypothetical protein
MQIPLVQAFANIIPALVNTSTRNVGTMQTSVPQMQTRPQCECNTQKPGIPIQAEHICNVNTSNEQRSVMKEQAVHKLRLCDQGVCDQGGFGQCASQRRGPSSCEDGWPSGVVVTKESSELSDDVRDVVSACQALRRRCRSH